MKKCLCFLMAILLLIPACAMAGRHEKVFLEGETDPFPEDAVLLTLRVCPQMGADSMLLTLGEHSMLVDAGLYEHYDLVRKMLDEAGLTELEYVYNSHPHEDHIGGVKGLLEEGFPIGTFFTVFPHDYTSAAVQQAGVLHALERAHVPIADLKTEDTIPFGDAQIVMYRVPDPCILSTMDCNDLSGMLLITYGECSVLLTGDVELLSQPKLAERYDLKADIMKYPHHGIGRPHRDFLQNADPEYIFITNGSMDTQDEQMYLRKKGYDRLTFTTWGPITMQTDGTKWIVTQEIYPSKREYVNYFWKHFWDD
ncbi:MAG: MBL fold metallo-hydrolase [Clostridia bacterium]|nr:MBL fold metallo-hydrolase [Clostridia bacterium]